MNKMVCGAAALALMAALVTTSSAGADPTVDAHLSIDVVVVGAPPPGATVTLVHSEGVGDTPDLFPVTLADVVDGPEVADFVVHDIGHGIYVDPSEVGGADAIDYSCVTSGVDGSTPDPMTRCDELAPSGAFPVIYAYTQFWGQQVDTVAERSDITVTLTFDPPCDGREVTVNLARGQVPTAGADVILGTSSGDDISGLGGSDRICGGGGRDTIRGGPGRDRLLGGVGADRLEGGKDGDALFGQAGADALDGGALSDTCNGGTERDTSVRCEVRSSIP